MAVDATGNLFIADTYGPSSSVSGGGSVRMVAAGTGTTTVTVEPFASIAPGYTSVISPSVPTGYRNRHAEAIVLALASSTDASAAARPGNYLLTTAPNREGRVVKIRFHRVNFDPATNIVSIFPNFHLNPHRTYRLIIGGQPIGPVALLFNRAGIISETV